MPGLSIAVTTGVSSVTGTPAAEAWIACEVATVTALEGAGGPNEENPPESSIFIAARTSCSVCGQLGA